MEGSNFININKIENILEEENQDQEQFNDEDEQFETSLEIQMFEQKIKDKQQQQQNINNQESASPQKSESWKKPQNQFKMATFDELKEIQQTFQQMITNEQKPKKQSKIEEITNQIITNKTIKETPTKHSFKITTETLKNYGVDDLETDSILETTNENLKNKKIKELVAKNKNLQVLLEKEKASKQKMQKEFQFIVKETDKQLQNVQLKEEKIEREQFLQSSKGGLPPPPTKKQENDPNQELKELRILYNQVNKKAAEAILKKFLLKISTLKSEYNKAIRVITREIGDNHNLDEILSQDNSWKGRAQQIDILKSKLKELQKYNKSQSEFSDNLGMSKKDPMLTSQKQEKRTQELIATIQTLKKENEDLVLKSNGLSSRKTVLEKQIKEVKEDFEKNKKLFLEKSENDNKYINALKAELVKVKNAKQEMQTKVIYKNVEQPAIPKIEEFNKLKSDNKYLESELQNKDQIIKELINEKMKASSTFDKNKEPSSQDPSPQLIDLQKTINKLNKENETLKQKLYGTSDKETILTIKDLSTQNAQLRKKIDDLSQKLQGVQKKQ